MQIKQKFLLGISPLDQQRYLDIVFDFFSELKIAEDDIIKLLNKTEKKYFLNLLYALIFYQYAEKIISEKDDIIKPVLIICLVDAIEDEKKIQLRQKLEKFLKRLDPEDKVYLIDRVQVMKRYRGKTETRKLYHNLIIRNKIFKNCWRDATYRDVDPDSKHLDEYTEKLSDHLYGIRNFVLHESRQVSFALNTDEELKILPSSFFQYSSNKHIGPKGNKRKIKKRFLLWSNIELTRFRQIIKRGIIRKIESR